MDETRVAVYVTTYGEDRNTPVFDLECFQLRSREPIEDILFLD